MAEENKNEKSQSPAKYKFGQKELNLANYIHNLGLNVQSYMDSKNWSEGQRAEFTNSFNKYLSGLKEQLETGSSRFSTDDFGTITDLTGALNNTDDDGIDPVNSEYYYNDKGEQITTDDYKALKTKKQSKYKSFSANKEVASYFNKIGRAMKGVDEAKPTEKEKFDLKKHGFLADWVKINNPAGGEFNLAPYIDKDVYDETTGKRGTSERSKYLQEAIRSYIQNLSGDYNFEGTPFKDLDDYKARLATLAEKLTDGWSNDDIIAANQAGIDTSFYNNFFTTQKDPSISKEDLEAKEKADKEAKEKKEAEEKRKQYIDELARNFESQGYKYTYGGSENFYVKPLQHWNDGKFDSISWSEQINEDDPRFSKYYKENEHGERKFDEISYWDDYLVNPFASTDSFALSGLVGTNGQMIESGDLQGMYYIPQENDVKRSSALIYDPVNRRLFYTFIGRVPHVWDKLENKYNRTGSWQSEFYKEGGKFQLGGNVVGKLDQLNELQTSEKAAEKGMTDKQYKASRRQVLSGGNAYNSEGFNGTDITRLSSVALDVVSLISAFAPGVGTAVSAATGIGSTLANFGADWSDDSVSAGDMWANFGMSLGMDVLGLIPGGGAASKGAKIAKTLTKYVPAIVATIGTMNTLTNGPAIINSLKKLDKPSEMTVEDWRNIGQGLSTILGATGAGARVYKTKKLKKAAAKPDSVAVELADANGNKKMVAFTGEDAKAIRESGGSVEGVKKITSKYEDLKDLEVSLNDGLSLRMPFTKGADGKRHWNPIDYNSQAKIFDVSAGTKNFQDNGKWWNKGTTSDTTPTNTEYAIRGAWTTDTPVVRSGKTTSEVDALEKEYFDQLIAPIQKESKWTTANRDRVQKIQDTYGKSPERISELQKKQTPKGYGGTGEGLTPKEELELQKLQAITSNPKYSRLINWLNTVNQANYHTKAYNDFKTKYVDAQGNVNIKVPNTNRTIQRSFSDIVRELGLFKQGGSLNMSKLRKFQSGGKSNTTVDADWYNDVFKSSYMQNWINDLITKGDLDTFNNLQKSWRTNQLNTGYTKNTPSVSYNQGVFDRQGKWNQTGNNAVFGDLFKAGKITRPGNTGDNEENGYVDGYFGEQEYLRHGGSKETWEGKEELLKQVQGELAKKGISYTLDPESNMYLLGRTQETTQQQSTSQQSQPRQTVVADEEDSSKGSSNEESQNNKSFNISSVNPSLLYGIPRAYYADKVNRRITDQAIASERPFLKDPFEFRRSIYSDLDSEIQGQRAAGALMSRANRPLTSDGNLQTAAQLEAQTKGQEFINAGKEHSNDMLRQTSEQAWLQEKENALSRHTTAQENKLAMLKTLANQDKHRMVYESKKHNIWDTVLQQMEFEAKSKQAEKESYAKAFAEQDIARSINYNLGEVAKQYKVSLTDEQQAAWDKVKLGGISYSSLSDDEKSKFIEANRIAEQLRSDMLAEYLNIPDNKYTALRQRTSKKSNSGWTPTGRDMAVQGTGFQGRDMKTNKKGGTLDKAQMKNADRFQKQIKESLDRHEKVLDRLSKSMYKYINDAIK